MASVWDGISPEQRGKIEETFQKTGIPGLATLVKRYPEHWREILNHANTLKRNGSVEIRTHQLENWIKQQNWEAKPIESNEATNKKKFNPMSKQFPNLTVKQANAAMSIPENPGDPIVARVANQYSEVADAIIEHAKPGMTTEELVTFAKEQMKQAGKEIADKQKEEPRYEDRTPSKDKAEEYPVDEEIDNYIQYAVDSFIDSLKNIARTGVNSENDNAYKAARKRLGDFYIYAKGHSKEKNQFKLEDYTKQFKVPDNWEADSGNVPEHVGQMMSKFRKVQLYDFRYTIESGNNRFTSEYNQLYKLFYFLFVVCFLIKEDPQKYINKKFKFTGLGTESFQSLDGKCVELLKKIHKDTLGEESDLEQLNIKNQSNKVTDVKRDEVVDAMTEAANVTAENEASGETEAKSNAQSIANSPKSKGDLAKQQANEAREEQVTQQALANLDREAGIDPNSPEAQEATKETIQAQEAAAQDKDKDTSKFDLAWWIKIKKEYEDYIKDLGENKDQIANSQVVKVLDKLYATPDNDKQLFNLQQGNIYLGCTHIYSAVFPANNKIGYNTIRDYYPIREVMISALNTETNKKTFKGRMAEKQDRRELQRDTANAADQVKKEVDKAPEIVKLIPNKNNTGTTSKAWHANAVRVWCVTKLLFKLLPGKLEGDEIKDDWLNKMRNHYAEKLKDCTLNRVIGNKDIYSRATGDLYDQKTHHILVPTDTNDDKPSAEKFIFAFYDQLLVPVGDPKETLKRLNASLEALPTETAENLKALLYKTHVQTKSRKEQIKDQEYNPTKGLNVLRDYLEDLYDKETRKQYGKEWKIPTVDNEYAMKADALYRILCQDEMKQDSLFVSAFKKYITMVGKYVLANNETKNRERVVTRL